MCDSESRWESASEYVAKMDMFSYSDSEFDEEDQVYDDDLYETASENSFDMAGSLVEVLGTTPRLGRRSMALADIDPKYVSQSGIWEASEVETSRGSIRIQHLTAVAAAARPLNCTTSVLPVPGPSRLGSRFPKLEDCAHFHYDILELPLLKITLRDEPSKYASSVTGEETIGDNLNSNIIDFLIEVSSAGQSWTIRRTFINFKKLDEQLHKCVWDRSFSQLQKANDFEERVQEAENAQDAKQLDFVKNYCGRLSLLPTDQITCGTVLSWLEIDNRGRHIGSSDDCDINTPAVAAACAIRQYVAKASDELSFEIGDMISVIDMPPPEESSWWRGKRKFAVGFFPRDCVQVIGEKVPTGLARLPSPIKSQRLSSVSSASSSTTPSPVPDKPVLRKHGKLIAFFRSFILARPSRRRLKQTGILRERVFGCDLAEHLMNSGTDVPVVLTCCAEFIELEGIVDGIYRISGITSNIQKLRNSFDEDRIPNLPADENIKQDIHAVSSLLKMYFRELPNPLCTYQLYNKFREAIEASDDDRLLRIREVAQELPPPHYRTLEYLLKHLARVAEHSSQTGMTARNMAIVWAPNLIRCKDLEAGGVTALKGIGLQAIVTEYLVRHADLIFNDVPPEKFTTPSKSIKSLPLSPPVKFLSLNGEEDVNEDDRKFIEVGGGPSSLPDKYHTVINIPGRRSNLKGKRSAAGWRTFFSRNRSFSKGHRKTPEIVVGPPTNVQHLQSHWPGKLPLRPVKSVESLVSTSLYQSSPIPSNNTPVLQEVDETLDDEEPHPQSVAILAQEVKDVAGSVCSDSSTEGHAHSQKVSHPKTHNRSISHDSYFEFNDLLLKVPVHETVEEEEDDTELSLDTNNEACSQTMSPRKDLSSGVMGDTESISSDLRWRSSFATSSSALPNTSSCSLVKHTNDSFTSAQSTSSDDPGSAEIGPASPLLKPKPRYSILKNSPSQSADTDSGKMKLVDLETVSSNYSEGDSCTAEIHRSYEHALNSCHIRKEFYLPLEGTMETSNTGNNPYEIDRNSSLDNSSTDTTPGVEATGTNIVYSPLVNDNIPSPDSSKFKFLEESIPLPALPASSVFVCPLYESNTRNDATPVKKSKPNEGTSLEPKKSFRTQIRQYENIEILVPSTEDDCFVSSEEIPPLWQQERIYQNIGQHVEPRPFNDCLQQEVRVIHLDGNTVKSPTEDEDEENDELCDQHYENVAIRDLPSRPDSEENLYEANIYEDIEDDDDEKAISSCPARPPSLPNRNSNRSPDPRSSCMSNSSDVGEAYESVQFGSNASDCEHLYGYTEADCYAEVGTQAKYLASTSRCITKNSDSHSQCQTESIVNYLDLQNNYVTETSTGSLGHMDSETPTRNDSTSNAVTPSMDEEIRHIDSPVVIGNPLYGLELQEGVTACDKLVGRSSSVPLTDSLNNLVENKSTKSETPQSHSLPVNIPEKSVSGESKRIVVDSKDVNIIDSEMLLLWKRLSEPSLVNVKKEDKAAALDAAWKLADAKRLANRKQSVRELLSKFEQKDSLPASPSPTNNSSMKSPKASPGLPRPDKLNAGGSMSYRNSSSKFQHHRFSVGDILMSQSLTSPTAARGDASSPLLMSRSDTFPELRTDASKENETLTVAAIAHSSVQTCALVPENIQSAIRVAMSSVDMNDPNTRERIEKYKEERRLFLRQKIGPEHTDVNCSNAGHKNNDSTKSLSSAAHHLNSFDEIYSKNYSEGANVFPDSNITNANTTEEQAKGCADSPRKRAFSEDVNSKSWLTNQNKAIKTENFTLLPYQENNNQPMSCSTSFSSIFSTANVELVTDQEINVKEKVALWSSSMAGGEKKPYSSPYVDSLQRSSASRSKPSLMEACSLPIEGEKKTPSGTPEKKATGLRRELTTGSIDLNKVKLVSRTNPGDSSKKIKDMAAFFEAKHF